MVYTVVKFLLWPILKLYNQITIHGLESVPRDGAFILVANHTSYLDPVYIGISIPRKLHFMAKKEAFEQPIFRWLMTQLGAFPVDRNRLGLKTVKQAMAILKEQEVLAIFPQGTRKGEIEITEIKQGASYFSIKTGTPILPVYIKGTDKVMPKGQAVIKPVKVEIYFGKMIDITVASKEMNNDQAMEWVTEQIKEEMNRLVQQAN